jgi:hypothetical protein
MAQTLKQKPRKKREGELRGVWLPEFSGPDRDDNLRSLLPSSDSPYDFRSLSQAETLALEEAFSDGFGSVTARGAQALPLPRGIKTGLLRHSYFSNKCSEDDDYEDPIDAFWERDSFDDMAPADKLPIAFNPRRLRMYFTNQIDRFCDRVISEDPVLSEWYAKYGSKFGRSLIEDLAFDRLYEKPWYEAHAMRLFENIDELRELGSKLTRRAAPAVAFVLPGFGGQLGRLIEQYYWRFRYEGAAITGLGARRGASAGGASKAALHRAQHVQWQKVASEVWERRAGLSKIAVAKIIRTQSGVPRTAKHIARYISRIKSS